MKMVLGVLAVLCLSGGAGELKMKIPATLYPVPEKRSMDRKTIAAAEAYLKLSPEKLASLVPKEPPAPVLTETAAYSSSYHQGGCPFCGLSGKWFRYDLVNDPDRIYCMQTGKELSEFGSQGSDFFLDYSGRKYARKYYLSPHVKPIRLPGPVKAYPENYLAKERIQSLCGTWSGGVLPSLAKAYYATGDERYAERVIAVLEAFAKVLPSYPWMGHSSTVPQPRSELLAKAAQHDSGYHGWLGPARLAASENNFRTPMEAVYFNNLAHAYMMVEPSKSWNGRRELVRKKLFEEGSLLFRAYGAKQCMGNGIGMYAPVLNSLGIVLQDEYLYGGFLKIMEDFLYNENFHDGISTEGSVAYSGMVGGMWGLFRSSGLAEDPEYLRMNPFLRYAGMTRLRASLVRGGNAPYGDDHPSQYWITKPVPEKTVPGEEFGGFGLSIIRAGAADKRMELFFQHDRVSGHSHDDMLGIQLFYRGIPMLEHYGDTRQTVDLTDKVPDAEKFRALKYPAPFVTEDTRPRGFSLQDMTTGLTKNTLIIDEYWAENGWYAAYRGGQGDRRAPYGNLVARTGRFPEKIFQFVEADGIDMNAKSYQGIRLYKRAFAAVTRPDGTPYLVDFFSVSGGHRHLLLFHSRGREIDSTLTRGRDYRHLEDLPDDTANSFKMNAADIFQPRRVLNNVNLGGDVRGSWRHAWLFDYAAWAPKTVLPLQEMLVEPHVLSIHGFLNRSAKAVRAEGHYPVTIREFFNGRERKYRFQFENAIHYAGLRAQSKQGLSDCYIQCYSFHAEKEKPLLAGVSKIPCDDHVNQYKSAVEILFADGSRDIVVWQPFSEMTAWDGELFLTDARAALIRINSKGKVKYVAVSGGTKLIWRGRTLIGNGSGTLTGRLERLEGDISGDPSRSVLVLTGAENWPEGDVLKGHTVIAAYNRGKRREAYTVERIERQGKLTLVHLANAPFFIDHRGEVRDNMGRGEKLLRGNQFSGTATGKGGELTHYLSGSKVTFPELGLIFTLENVDMRHDSSFRWSLCEPVDLVKAGVKTGMRFQVFPDWKDSIIELMTTTERSFEK